ncbi:MAG: type II secretion system minor pseudopilin GspI [SAR86 cluster bacterium]|jgi:general secretion pathway protein I|tara:strand:- start:31899 stop:32282 length:384 start_codon:yes stop_codon:yes gene_type:complete
MRNRRTAGFTLLEVMIALAVFAVVSAALVRNAAVAVRQTTIIQDRSLGIWVAENQLSQMRIQVRDADNYPAPGTNRYAVNLADRDWEVVVKIAATENADVRRVGVEVFAAQQPDQALADLAGFLGRY